MGIEDELHEKLLGFQRNELTEHHIYSRLAAVVRSPENRELLARIAQQELDHYQFWREHTGRELKPSRLQVWVYYLISRLLGLTFGLKLMERGEEEVQDHYAELRQLVPGVEHSSESTNTSRPCSDCSTRRGCATPAPSCWVSTMRWLSSPAHWPASPWRCRTVS
jgi:demethoxyubiquinone hydroxylase (CLK1/Coq7/Cat5 family)